jgi:folate-binding protein YgfZ
MAIVTQRTARRARDYVRVAGQEAEDFLQRMVSNDVSGDVCEALLLTAKGRVIAPLVVWRRASDDFLLLTEPGLGDVVRATLLRARFATKLGEGELELLRIEAATPAWGKEIDEKVLPAEAGLDERAVSYTKGCYPGQEPIARLHYRGHANRALRLLDVELAQPEEEIVYEGKVVGRVTSAVPGRALGYVRVAVPEDAKVQVGDITATLIPPKRP